MKKYLGLFIVAAVLVTFFGMTKATHAQADDPAYDITSVDNADGSYDIVASDSDTLEIVARLECPVLFARRPVGRKLPEPAACFILNKMRTDNGCASTGLSALGCLN